MYHFVKCTSSPGPGEESSAESFADMSACAPSSWTATVEKSCSSDSETESCPGSQSGMTCEPLTDGLGEGTLMLCAEGSRVKTLAAQEKAQESKVSEADSGWKWPESYAKYDPDTHSWRTRQGSLLADSEECLETFPKWGMAQNGALFPLPTPYGLLAVRQLIICANESGYERITAPTPKAEDNQCCGAHRGKPDTLHSWVRVPTPKAQNATGSGPSRVGHREDLQTFVNRLPTPQARDWKGKSQWGVDPENRDCLPNAVGGQLNPNWEEWLMGWPIGWTALKPLEMGRFQEWLDSHGRSCVE